MGGWNLAPWGRLGCLAVALLLLAPAGASAALSDEDPWGGIRCTTGTGAGECSQPRGIAASPETGHVFVNDNFNSRMVEFDPLGEFVRAWGWDVVASGPGDDTTAPEDEFEICEREAGDVCKEGTRGSGAGQFNRGVVGVALDAAGDVYVIDRNNRRVQKFDRKGNFLLMFGGEVNKTTGADVCTREDLEGGEECGAGTTGSAAGEFGAWAVGDFISVDPSDNVYVGDVGRIQHFDTGGAYQSECAVPGGGNVESLATDSVGSLYALYAGQPDARKLSFAAGGECEEGTRFEAPPPDKFTNRSITAIALDHEDHLFAFADPPAGNGFVPIDRIFEFDQAGKVIESFGKGEFASSTGIATNICAGSQAPGNLYVTNFSGAGDFVRAYGTEPVGCFKARTLPATEVEETTATLNGTVNPDGALSEDCRFEYGTTTAYGSVAPCAEDEAAEIGEGSEPVPVHAELTGLEAATVYHFRLRAKIGGETQTGPDEQFKTKGPPVISDEHAAAVTESEAVLRASVNPEGLPTSCRVAYGAGGTLDRSSASVTVGGDRSEHSASATLTGLEPGTAYRWRFVCENTAALAGGIAEGELLTLTTYRAFAAQSECPNQALRAGASAFLPDCRAYEMVSPVDKNGADIVAGKTPAGDEVGSFVQATPGGEALTYAAKFPAFADAQRSFYFNQYLARRGAGGWANEGIHPPYRGEAVPGIAVGVLREFMAFTEDLCSAWMIDWQTPALNPDGQDEAANLYRRDSCGPGAGGFETLTDVAVPLAGEARSYYVDQFSVQGHSRDGAHALFRAKAKLIPDAAEGTNAQLYDRFGGALQVVSVLPNGKPDPSETALGSNWQGSLEGAVSADGSVVYWTSNISTEELGRIYARLAPEQGIVAGECEGGEPCRTVAVSKGTSVPFFHNAFFWAGARDGSRALYSETESPGSPQDLYRFELASGKSELIANDIMGVVGASEDLARIYFVSREVLPESGANSAEE
ncbi:MAG TPA: hypothetical protein VFD37_01355 [Solirubrobacterales bacterium]|nr:hypothetical protein [Solirubrobacterales bacterium]